MIKLVRVVSPDPFQPPDRVGYGGATGLPGHFGIDKTLGILNEHFY